MKKILFTLFMLLTCTMLSAQTRLNLVLEGLKYDQERWASKQQPIIDQYEFISTAKQEEMARRCHNIRLALYSRDKLGIFDLTYEIKRAIETYQKLEELAHPNSLAIQHAERDMLRMQYLLETLRRMPPVLDSIDEVCDSIASLESDTLLYRLYEGYDILQEEESSLYMLTTHEQDIRDTCIQLAQKSIYQQRQTIEILRNEAAIFATLRDEFRSTYDYVNARCKELNREIYYAYNQESISSILRHPITHFRETWDECYNKFTRSDGRYTLREFLVVLGEMFGMLALAILITIGLKKLTYKRRKQLIHLHRNSNIVANTIYMLLLAICLVVDMKLELPLITINAQTFAVYFGYVTLLQLSLLVRCAGQKAGAGMKLYVPSIFFGFFLVFMRMYFVPDSLLNYIMVPLTAVCWFWQIMILMREWSRSETLDNTIAMFTSFVLLVCAILTMIGRSLFALQLIFWWEAQQASIVTIAALYHLCKNYGDKHMEMRTRRYLEMRNGRAESDQTAIQITWLYDLWKMVGIPTLFLASIPACLYMSLGFLNNQDAFINSYYSTFFSLGTIDHKICDLSIAKITWCIALYFWFNIIRYISTCIYRQVSLRLAQKRSGQKILLANQLNLTLGTNLINLVVWGLYVVVISIILAIPLTALTVIIGAFTGGVGFAMKDVVNNIIYGTQLMADRLRVGDYIICDNYRGAVTSISYQTTQIETEEGALVSFTNSDLFSKNFQNLTRRNPYEVNRVMVDVAYGSDIEKVERLIREAIEPLNQKDQFGRPLLSAQDGLRIEMRDLSSSSIVMAVRFAVIAERRSWFLPIARKAIYKNLIKGGIHIPFPQVDVHFDNIAAAVTTDADKSATAENEPQQAEKA